VTWFRETDIFMVGVKQQNMSHKKPYFQHHFFPFLHNPNDKLIFYEKTICTCSKSRSTHDFLAFQNVSKMPMILNIIVITNVLYILYKSISEH
jgi:hypothetical protein